MYEQEDIRCVFSMPVGIVKGEIYWKTLVEFHDGYRVHSESKYSGVREYES